MRRKWQSWALIGMLVSISVLSTGFPQEERSAPGIPSSDGPAFKEFQEKLEVLRRQLKIPGMAAGIMSGRRLVWAKGFGYADLENRIEASTGTPWHIASVTKTFAAIILLQLVEEGKLSLDDPLEKFGIHMKSKGIVRVRHILTHTSERRPGAFFRYSGRLWEHLARVIKEASGRSFKELLVERIIKRLELADTAPNKESEAESYPFDEIRSRAAVLYGMDKSHNPKRHEFLLGFCAAGGLFSSVRDMAVYDAAVDGDLLLKPETKKLMFTPYSSADGKIFPHGLGWFCQDFCGTRLLWHFGWHPDHTSALIVKVPERDLSFMIFANSDKLSQPFNLLHGDVLNSPAALLFLKMIVFPGEYLAAIADREAVTNDIIMKTSGRKPVISPVQTGILILCLLGFLSAPILWTAYWILRRLRVKKKAFASYRSGLGSGICRIYALISVMFCVLFLGALWRAPFLMYWPELPGWVDGISLAENLFLALPTLLALLGIGMMIFTIWIWLKKYWSLFDRVHYTLLAALMIAYDLLLDHWNLISISYYWNYFL